MNKYLINSPTIYTTPVVPIYKIVIFLPNDEISFFTQEDVKKGDIILYGNKRIKVYDYGDEYDGPDSVLLIDIRLQDLAKGRNRGRDVVSIKDIYMQVWPRSFIGGVEE